jgi:hypothetical protein
MQYIGYRNVLVGQDSVVDIATGYVLECPEILSGWDRKFPYPSRSAVPSCQPPVKWITYVFALGKVAWV